jgi:putative FmdB family regulatory protein
MPTYEYACRSCDQVVEVFQSMRDEPLAVCPRCGKPGLKRLIGRGAGIIFKGSGFYETDYKRSGSDKGADAAGAAAPGEGGAAKPAPAAPATSGSPPPASTPASPAAAGAKTT